MITVISVSKSYIHRGKNRHKRGTKKRWHLYYYDEEGRFMMKRISSLQAMYYKARKSHRYRYNCMSCGFKFVVTVKSRNEKVNCPYCSSSIV